MAVARDDAGDVRAVPVVVVGAGLEVHEVDKPRDAAGSEVVVPVGHAGIDDRDADAGAVEAERILDPGGADRRAGALQRAVHAPVETDAVHPRQARERSERRVGNARDQAAAAGKAAPQRAAEAPDEGVGRVEGKARIQADDDARVTARRAGALPQFEVKFRAAALDGGRRSGRRRGRERPENHAESEQTSNHFAGCQNGCAGAIHLPVMTNLQRKFKCLIQKHLHDTFPPAPL